MARDAIARQYDVDKHTILYTCEDVKGGYKPGTITFQAKPGKSIDLEKMRESIAATRLSGGTSMKMDWLEIVVRGEVAARNQDWLLKVSGSDQEFFLRDEPGAKGMLKRLVEAQAGGVAIASITGRVQGWSGVFPAVLKAQAPNADGEPKQKVLLITRFEIAKK